MNGLEIAQAQMKVAFSAKVWCPSEHELPGVGLRFSIEDMIMGERAEAALVLSGEQVIAKLVFYIKRLQSMSV